MVCGLGKKNRDSLESRNISLHLISHDTKVIFKLKASRGKCKLVMWGWQIIEVDKKGTRWMSIDSIMFLVKYYQ